MAQASLVRVLVPLYLAVILGAPIALAAAPVLAAETWPWRLAWLLAAAPVYALSYVLLAGCLSRLTIRAIVPGKYPRDLGHRVYGPRRLYALCWTAIYYHAPLYHAVLAVPVLKRLTFRLFGERGGLAFQSYPGSWIRDLPLLSVGKGAYLSNKATVSPNMCLKDGTILILPVSIGAGTLIGHLTMVAPGVEIGDDCDVGVGASVGVRARMGSRSSLGHCAQIDHQAVIGIDCEIGNRAYIGRRAVLHDGVRVPPGMVVPGKCVLASQADVDALAGGVVLRHDAVLPVGIQVPATATLGGSAGSMQMRPT